MKLNPAIANLLPTRRNEERTSYPLALKDWAELLPYNGVGYPMNFHQTLTGGDVETIGDGFEGYIRGVYKANGVVFACLLTRMMHFSEARFLWRRMRNGRPGPLFSDKSLLPLERPWDNAATGDLLNRMIQDGDIDGNFFGLRQGDEIQRLYPAWVEILIGSRTGRADFLPGDPDEVVAGYRYWPGGRNSGRGYFNYDVAEIAHFKPIPDPSASYKGMSIVTAALRSIQADQSMERHRQKFFDNGATVNMVVKLTPPKMDEFNEYVRKFRAAHDGTENAYKTLYVTGATDVQAIGSDMQQLDFKVTQGAGESRIAAALRVHPTIVGLSEGMQGSSLNAGNYQAVRRLFADGTMRPLWRQAARALESILDVPPARNSGESAAELWYDERDISFLQEDAKDIAEVQQMKAGAALSFTNAGWKPDAIIDYLANDDIRVMDGQHSGLFTVQLQEPGAGNSGGTSSGQDVAQTGNA